MRTCIVALAFVSLRCWAHHASVQEFDLTKLILLRGTIQRVEWTNPHAWLYLDVKSPDGSITTWQIEGASPNALVQNKFPKDAVTQGMEISITAYPARSAKALRMERRSHFRMEDASSSVAQPLTTASTLKDAPASTTPEARPASWLHRST